MFLYNAMWAWNASSVVPHGNILHAVGCPLTNADTRGMPASRNDFTLFDPNSYLWDLDGADCGRAVECIESYPWVPIPAARVDLSAMSAEQVTSVLRTTAAWQSARGVSRVILPTPLISDPNASIDEFLRWMDLAIQLTPELDRPVLLALGFSDIALGAHFATVLDQITARENVPGVYTFIETSRSSGSVAINQEVARALLMISHFVGQRLKKEVVVNFADVFGLACLSVGATAFAGGYERKCQTLDFENFVERNGGGPFPKFFSLSTASYYRPERDMERVRDQRLLRILTSDRTTQSDSLFAALAAGGRVADVPEWRESRNNVTAARAHLIERLCDAADEVAAISGAPERASWALSWLQNAERDAAYLNSRFDGAPLDDDGRHTRVWREAFEAFVEEYGLI